MASALVRAGKSVFLPVFGVNSRIDLVYGDEEALVRVQCKTSRVVGRVLLFRTCSTTNKQRRDYTDQVDEFGIYSPALNLVYLVPTRELPRTGGTLRSRRRGTGSASGSCGPTTTCSGRPSARGGG